MRKNALTGAPGLLTHPLRYRVLEAINRWPCSSEAAIAERLGLPMKQVGYQVRVLTAAGAVGVCAGQGLTADMDSVRAALDDELGV